MLVTIGKDMKSIFEQDILIYKKENGLMMMSINIDSIKQINFSSKKLYMFSADINDFISIERKLIDEISIYSKSKKLITKNELSFIENDFQHIKSLIINCECENFDYSFMNNLETIVFYKPTTQPFDFAKLKNLQEVFIFYHKNFDSIFHCNKLKSLEIHKYNKKIFLPFTQMQGLESLIIRQGNLADLTNIDELKKLSHFELSHNKSLSDLSPLIENNSIKNLVLDCCSKIKDFQSFTKMKKLEELQLENIKEIESLNFVKEIKSLKSITLLGRSNVIDGKLKWLLDTKDINLMCAVKKHYDVKWNALENGQFELIGKNDY